MHKQLTYQAKQLHYELLGQGPTVVLLHGFGEDSSVWRRQREVFPRYQLLIPDLPGSGASEMISDMSMEGLAQSILAILNEEQIQECVLVGHSMGGYIALAFAEKYTNKLKGLGLFHSTAYADTASKKETRQKGIEFINQYGASAFLKTSTPNLFSDITKERRKELIEEQLQQTATFTDAALITYYESMMQRPDRTAVLEKSIIPILFIIGKYDTAIPLTDSLQQSHLPAISYVHLLDASGHMGMLEETDKSNQALNDYLSDLYKTS
jgi:pimeloyl-ACP methyl ester carboxylesterase